MVTMLFNVLGWFVVRSLRIQLNWLLFIQINDNLNLFRDIMKLKVWINYVKWVKVLK